MKDKELAKQEYLEMIKKSWTWAKLTEKEKDRFLLLLDNPCSTTVIKGDYDQRWDACEALYHTFLVGLDYDPLNWRDNYLETTHYEINYKDSGKDKQKSMTDENPARMLRLPLNLSILLQKKKPKIPCTGSSRNCVRKIPLQRFSVLKKQRRGSQIYFKGNVHLK